MYTSEQIAVHNITGSIVNPGAKSVTSITVVVTTYDADGNVTGFRQAKLPDELPAGGNVEFAISLMPHDGVPANYAVGVQGRLENP